MPSKTGPLMTGLSGNEMYCLNLKGLEAGELLIGNSVYSLGLLGSIGAGFRAVFGGEVTQITSVISEGRHLSQSRLMQEAHRHGADGVTGVTSELRTMQGNVEFLSIASGVHQTGSNATPTMFSSSFNGQELYCMMDAGYEPRQFVFGNVAYSIGIGRGIMGGLKQLKRGEIKEYSNVFNQTRHLALERIASEAVSATASPLARI